MKKRHFLKGVCASVATLGLSGTSRLLSAANTLPYESFNSVLLVDQLGEAIRLGSLEPGVAYLFFYPYVTTPCYLIDVGEPLGKSTQLKTKSGEGYRWQGGVGPNKSVVAFSAICAHKLSHPTKHVSFINYRHSPIDFLDGDGRTVQQSKVIQCCSERSVYDVRRGGAVIGGPAPQPLAAIDLEYSPADNTICACGSFGGGMYKEFIEMFGFRLALEFGIDDAATLATRSTTAVPASVYTEQSISC